MESGLKIEVNSEIGKLEAVILHEPGPEVENMTPRNVQRALYSDILNLSIARKEYEQLASVLSGVSKVYHMKDLLCKVLDRREARTRLLQRICVAENATEYYMDLLDMDSAALARVLVEGLPARINSLTSFVKNEYYALYPLYNFYFMRDAAVTMGNAALICRMANRVRMRESFIMNAIYAKSGEFDCKVLDANDFQPSDSAVMMEGGDILVIRDDILLVGNGVRTSTQGIDFLVDHLKKTCGGKKHIIVQQLPSTPESFIHLDMAFTMLDVDSCMIFKPLILDNRQFQTIHITLDNGNVTSIRSVPDILSALRNLGIDLEPVICGGNDEWDQEREQWHSGANFFAFAPGKVISYARNVHTLEQLDRAGYAVISAEEIMKGGRKTDDYRRCVVTIEGSELPRGGGGARCMTMPLSRRKVDW